MAQKEEMPSTRNLDDSRSTNRLPESPQIKAPDSLRQRERLLEASPISGVERGPLRVLLLHVRRRRPEGKHGPSDSGEVARRRTLLQDVAERVLSRPGIDCAHFRLGEAGPQREVVPTLPRRHGV